MSPAKASLGSFLPEFPLLLPKPLREELDVFLIAYSSFEETETNRSRTGLETADAP